jgi:hypothetical protein
MVPRFRDVGEAVMDVQRTIDAYGARVRKRLLGVGALAVIGTLLGIVDASVGSGVCLGLAVVISIGLAKDVRTLRGVKSCSSWRPGFGSFSVEGVWIGQRSTLSVKGQYDEKTLRIHSLLSDTPPFGGEERIYVCSAVPGRPRVYWVVVPSRRRACLAS